jgi:murein DD-endopeptidase MepM/ murein hydrolase activator NlpD
MFRVCACLAYLLLAVLARPALAQLALPVSPACVSSPYGARNAAEPRASHFHTGVDLPAPAGAWVHAAAAGTVVAIRRRGAAGLEVEIRHSSAMTTRYDHLGNVAPALQSGKRQLKQGDVLGRIGRTGITYGTHLHFELLLNGNRVDPALALGVKHC